MLLAFGLAATLSACSVAPGELGREPALSPVGAGFVSHTDPAIGYLPMPHRPPGGSLFEDGSANLFTDPRASRVGDVITVIILINDKATFGNTSDRSQTAKETGAFDWTFGLDSATHKVNGAADINASASSTGAGTIDRSEKLQLALAGVVTRVLPNGNLIINGSQEVRVNFELRQLQIAGIVRPRDISKDNTIAYEKMAEARVAYGGRGRLTEVQQPAWGQQVFDAVKPF